MDLNKPNKHNDIPYEIRMKYIIKDYMKMFDSMDKLANYTKSLEKYIDALKEDLARRKLVNIRQSENLVETRRKCKRLQATIDYLQEQLAKYKSANEFNDSPDGIIDPTLVIGDVPDGDVPTP